MNCFANFGVEVTNYTNRSKTTVSFTSIFFISMVTSANKNCWGPEIYWKQCYVNVTSTKHAFLITYARIPLLICTVSKMNNRLHSGKSHKSSSQLWPETSHLLCTNSAILFPQQIFLTNAHKKLVTFVGVVGDQKKTWNQWAQDNVQDTTRCPWRWMLNNRATYK